MRQIIYCYGDGHPLMLNVENINDADRMAILGHLTSLSPIRCQVTAERRPVDECDQCGAKRQPWQNEESDRCPNHANPLGSCDGTLRRTEGGS